MSPATETEDAANQNGRIEMLSCRIDFKAIGALVVAIALSAPADASAETLRIGGTAAISER